MDRWRKKVAVVTGASSGIGAAVVLHLLKHGMTVVGVARRADKIKELEKMCEGEGAGELHALNADLSREEDIDNVFQYVKDKLKSVHVLINNAGIARPGFLSGQSSKHMRDVLDVNVIGLTLCTQKALSLMTETNVTYGHIINMNSVLGHKLNYFTDTTAMYGPSKFAVTALTEMFRKEMRNAHKKIKFTSISPGQVDTEILNSSRAAVGIEPTHVDIPALQARDIADAVVYVLSTPPHLLIHEIIVKHIDEAF